MSRDLFALWMAANVAAIMFYCWARYVAFWRDRGPRPVRRHGRPRPMLDKLLGIK